RPGTGSSSPGTGAGSTGRDVSSGGSAPLDPPDGRRSDGGLGCANPLRIGTTFSPSPEPKDCTPCPSRSRCTKAAKEPWIIGLQAREHHEALQGTRREQVTEAFRSRYAARAGI